MPFIFLYIPCGTSEEAKKIARHLLNTKLIACANFFPVQSLYWGEGKIQEEAEVVLLLKTEKKKSAAVRKEVERLHSYSVPCIAQLPVTFNEKYGQWLLQQI